LFVARFLASHFASHAAIHVETRPDIWLDAECKEKGIPDIVLRRDGLRYLVLDTKYKTFSDRPEKNDRNQLVTYCHTLGLHRGILIYADDRTVDHHATFKDIVLDAQALALHGSLDEFKERCEQFAGQFESML